MDSPKLQYVSPDTCACNSIIWEDILVHNKVLLLTPFASIKRGTQRQCHLCTVLYGSLKVFNTLENFIPLTDDCICNNSEKSAVRIYGDLNWISIQVFFGEEDSSHAHFAMLNVTTMPHNCKSTQPISDLLLRIG